MSLIFFYKFVIIDKIQKYRKSETRLNALFKWVECVSEVSQIEILLRFDLCLYLKQTGEGQRNKEAEIATTKYRQSRLFLPSNLPTK